MTHITYIGNFLSGHGLNPTYSEALVPQLAAQNFSVRPASRYLNPVARMLDMIVAVSKTPRKNACVIIDLCSGPRAFPAAELIARVCRLNRKRYVVVLHGGTLPYHLKASRRRLLNILKGAARVVSPSSYLANAFAEHVGVEIIPNAINLSHYTFRARKKPQPNFLYLRALHSGYGPLTAIEALSIVREKYPEARMVMAGPDLDDGLSKCRALAVELGLERSITFLGRVPKARIPELGNECDIFLNPTFVDNTPVSVVEAMAMGMCVITTNVGGLPYLLQDGKTGLLVPAGDANEMAAAIFRVLEQPDLAGNLSENARRAAERMDWSKVTSQWSSLIRSVAT
jgi:L-malate glycosyltransferase